MTKEFVLSEHEQISGYFPKDKVKEFIKIIDGLIEECENADAIERVVKVFKLRTEINKLAGAELTK